MQRSCKGPRQSSHLHSTRYEYCHASHSGVVDFFLDLSMTGCPLGFLQARGDGSLMVPPFPNTHSYRKKRFSHFSAELAGEK
eukprot:scaffold4990_cov176-Amphora_coffeaeformis.AAC.1